MLSNHNSPIFEYVRCNICNNDNTTLIARGSRLGDDLNIVICNQCGLIYHNPRMTIEGFADFYKNDYRTIIGHALNPELLFEQQVKHGHYIYDFAKLWLPRGGSILDIGSGVGGCLWVLRELCGSEATGIEPAVAHADWAQAHQRLNIIPGLFENVHFPDQSFDLIVVSQTLNHLLDPLGVLQRAYNLLKPSGRIYVEVLDFVYYTRLNPLHIASTIDHPYMFCPETMRLIMQYTGFQILKEESDAHHNTKNIKDRPNVHWRAIALKAKPVTSLVFPSSQSIIQQIQHNQLIYKKQKRRKEIFFGVDRMKKLVRKSMGDTMWLRLRNIYRTIARTKKGETFKTSNL